MRRKKYVLKIRYDFLRCTPKRRNFSPALSWSAYIEYNTLWESF